MHAALLDVPRLLRVACMSAQVSQTLSSQVLRTVKTASGVRVCNNVQNSMYEDTKKTSGDRPKKA